jgi:hypothetical protein
MHVALPRHQVPPRRQELRGFDAAALVHCLWSLARAIRQHLCPHDISVSFNHGVGAAKLMRFVWVEGCVNASEHHLGAAVARHSANFVASERIRRVDTDADDIARLDAVWGYCRQSFID